MRSEFLNLKFPARNLERLAICNVNIVPMDTQRTLPNHTVVIEAGQIKILGPSQDIRIDEDTMVVDGKGRVAAEPSVIIDGIPEPVHAAIRDAAADAAKRSRKGDDNALKENVRRAARRAAHDAWGKKPVTRVEIAWV